VEGHTIEFVANVFKVQTLSENQGGGLRVTLDLPETEIMALVELAECQRFGVALKISCALLNKQDQYAISEGSKRKPRWQTS
jgi:hypothetical protein